MNSFSRREWLSGCTAALALPWSSLISEGVARRPRLAAIVTSYTWLSHADVILGRLLDGCMPNGIRRAPRTELVSLYRDQVTERDMGQEIAGRHGIRLASTVEEALTLGGQRLAVDGVVFVGEHGDYPSNSLGQKLYPRAELFGRIAAVYRASGRSVPTFFDKHLSYDWDRARTIWQTVRDLRIPFLAGSSVPVTVRRPVLEIPLGAPLTEAVVTSYGELDAYGFHALEALQCMVERRLGGETGIRSAELIRGDAVWAWRAGPGRWSEPLLTAALARHPHVAPGRHEDVVKDPALFVLEYRDGLRAAVYTLNGLVVGRGFAAQGPASTQPWSTFFVEGGPPYAPEEGGDRPLPNFDGLAFTIEELMLRGQAPWPMERTVLTTGALAHLFRSLERGGSVDTPELAIEYRPAPDPFFQSK